MQSFTEEECVIMFCFAQQHLRTLRMALQIPDIIYTKGDHRFDGDEIMLFSLHRMAYPSRLQTLVLTTFGREYSQWSCGFRWLLDHIWSTFSHLWLDNLPYFVGCLPECAHAARVRLVRNGAQMPPNVNICGFIDGTIRAISEKSSYSPFPVLTIKSSLSLS
mgnify:CR=1 FL=1